MKAKFVRLLLLITITATTLSMTSCGKRSQEMTPASSVSAEKETVSYNFTSEDVKSLLDDLSDVYTLVGTVPDAFNFQQSVVQSVVWKDTPDVSIEGDLSGMLTVTVDPVALQAVLDGKMNLSDETSYVSSDETYTIDYPVTLHVVNEADTEALYVAGTAVFGYVPPTDTVEGNNQSDNVSSNDTPATDASGQNNANEGASNVRNQQTVSGTQSNTPAPSKKPANNTTSAPSNNSNSGNSNSSGSTTTTPQPSQPAHTHNWVAHTATRTVVDQDAYDEPIRKEQWVCNGCGASFDSASAGVTHLYDAHPDAQEYVCIRNDVVVGYKHHDAVTHTESYTDYYYCTGCNATK